LDQVKEASQNGQKWITEMEQRERKRTGIASLKVGYTKVFGYFIEVTKSQLSRVPTDYVRKQTLTTGERFITPDLKEYEALILNAQDRIGKLESELFAQVRAEIAVHASERILNMRWRASSLNRTSLAGIVVILAYLPSITTMPAKEVRFSD